MKDTVLIKRRNVLFGGGEGVEGLWTALGASFLRSQSGAQQYFPVFKVEDEASCITYPITPLPCGLKLKEETYRLSVQ